MFESSLSCEWDLSMAFLDSYYLFSCIGHSPSLSLLCENVVEEIQN